MRVEHSLDLCFVMKKLDTMYCAHPVYCISLGIIELLNEIKRHKWPNVALTSAFQAASGLIAVDTRLRHII